MKKLVALYVVSWLSLAAVLIATQSPLDAFASLVAAALVCFFHGAVFYGSLCHAYIDLRTAGLALMVAQAEKIKQLEEIVLKVNDLEKLVAKLPMKV